MLPRWHVLFGALFTLLIWLIAPTTNKIYLLLIFLSSFLINVDHYMNAAIKGKNPTLSHAFRYHKRLEEKQKGDLGYRHADQGKVDR